MWSGLYLIAPKMCRMHNCLFFSPEKQFRATLLHSLISKEYQVHGHENIMKIRTHVNVSHHSSLCMCTAVSSPKPTYPFAVKAAKVLLHLAFSGLGTVHNLCAEGFYLMWNVIFARFFPQIRPFNVEFPGAYESGALLIFCYWIVCIYNESEWSNYRFIQPNNRSVHSNERSCQNNDRSNQSNVLQICFKTNLSHTSLMKIRICVFFFSFISL